MKVSRRLPTSSPSPFLEKRLFRYEKDSTPAAILFGLFEELRLPIFHNLQQNLRKSVELMSDSLSKNILLFLLTPQIKSEYVFSVWNFDDFFLTDFFLALNEFLGGNNEKKVDILKKLSEKFPFEVFFVGNKVKNRRKFPTVYIEKGENSASLMYIERGIESYVVTSCRHIFPKEYMDKIDTKAGLCGVNDCQEVLNCEIVRNKSRILPSLIYFDLKTAVNFRDLSKYLRGSEGNAWKCMYCEVRNGVCSCTARCRLCIECVLVTCCVTGYAYHCPVCSERLSKELSVLAVAELANRVLGTVEVRVSTECDYCRREVGVAEGVREVQAGDRVLFACAQCPQRTRTWTSPLAAGVNPQSPIGYASPIYGNTPTEHTRHSSISCNTHVGPRRLSTPSTHLPLGDFMENCVICTRQTSCFTVVKALKHKCWICDDCIYVLYDAKWTPTCPMCRVYIGLAAFKAIMNWINARNDLRKMNIPSQCSICRQWKPRKAALKSERLGHPCAVCDSCLLNNHCLTTCPKCRLNYTPQDQQFTSILLSRVPLKCKSCKSNITSSFPKCRNGCLCSKCLLQEYLFTYKKTCIECKEPLMGNLPEVVNCSQCTRELVVKSETMNAVSGICDNGCILCCFCVTVSNKDAICSICGAEAESIELEHILKWQKSFNLGCYCGRKKGEKMTLQCGCKAHRECYPLITTCRVCGYEHKPQSQIRRLTNYISDV